MARHSLSSSSNPGVRTAVTAFHSLRRPARRVARLAGALLVATASAACPGQHHDGDAGIDDDGGSSHRTETVFRVEGSGNGDWELVSGGLSISELRIQSDLGAGDDPRITTLGFVTVEPDSSRLAGEAPPATYSQISLALSPASGHAAFEFGFVRGSGQVVNVRSSNAFTFVLRCEAPTSTESEDMLVLTLTFDGSELVDVLDAAGIAQAPGTTTLDETTAPLVVSAIEDVLADATVLGCEME